MSVRVLFFGHLRDFVPPEGVTLSLPTGSTVTQAAHALVARDTRFSDLLTRCRYAVNADFADASTVLNNNDELAFLPPMSGG